MVEKVHYSQWHVPFEDDQKTLRQIYQNLRSVGANQDDIPLMVQLVENPKFKMPGICLFHGAVDLKQHDFIHILLGRGMLEKDEAFAIGFTMGSTNKITTSEENLFAWIAKYLYPDVYKFDSEALEVFKDAVRLGFISDCEPLDQVDFEPYLEMPLEKVREEIGIESDLIMSYFRIEKKRYPDSVESQRLI